MAKVVKWTSETSWGEEIRKGLKHNNRQFKFDKKGRL